VGRGVRVIRDGEGAGAEEDSREGVIGEVVAQVERTVGIGMLILGVVVGDELDLVCETGCHRDERNETDDVLAYVSV
jgi:hypothetical protein